MSTLRSVRSLLSAILLCLCAVTSSQAAEPVAACQVAPADLFAWFRGEDSLRDWARPVDGQASTPTAPRFAAGKVGRALEFDGSYLVEVPDAVGFGSASFTIEAWVFPTQRDGAVDIIVNKERANFTLQDISWELGIRGPLDPFIGNLPEGNLAFFLGGVTGLPDNHGGWTDVGVAIPLDQWTHVALTVSPTLIASYVDGMLVRRFEGFSGAPNVTDSPFRIGGRTLGGAGPREQFNGKIDELGFYTRALSAGEISAIHAAGVEGKCAEFLSVKFAGAPQKVQAGGQMMLQLEVTKQGTNAVNEVSLTQPLPEGMTLVSATPSQGTFTNAAGVLTANFGALAAGGSASLQLVLAVPASAPGVITNVATATAVGGLTNLATALVRVTGPCASAPAGLVGWWSGDGHAVDAISGIEAPYSGTYGNAVSDLGLMLDGGGAAVTITNTAPLRLQDLSLEFWVKRANLFQASQTWPYSGAIMSGGIGSWAVAMEANGQIVLSQMGIDKVGSTKVIADLEWHHVAVTKVGGDVHFYVDGEEAGQASYGPTFTFDSSPYRIGALGDLAGGSLLYFWGSLDEVSVYDRALSGAEVQALFAADAAGKCASDIRLAGAVWPRVALDEEFRLEFTVRNTGDTPATGVVLTNRLPAGIQFVGSTNSQGSTLNLAGILRSDLGQLPAGSTATVTLTLRALVAGAYEFQGAVGRAEPDLTLANNQQTFAVEAVPLTLSVTPELTANEATDGFGVVQVSLSAPSTRPVSVDFYTLEGTARAGRDFLATNANAVIPPNTTHVFIPVPLINDPSYEEEETFLVVFTNAVGAPLLSSNSVVKITSDDAVPVLRVGNALVREGNSGATNALFELVMTGATELPVEVRFATTNDVAKSPTDFVATNGVVTFQPGEARHTVAVRVNGDSTIEPNEPFYLGVTVTNGAVVADRTGVGVILNDDFIPGQVSSFVWDQIPSPQASWEPIPARLTAVDGGGNPVPDFSGVVVLSAHVGEGHASPVVISEVETVAGDAVEFQNVTTNAVDVSGWKVTFYDAVNWPLPRGVVTVPDNAILETRRVFRIGETANSQMPFPTLGTGFSLGWGSLESPNVPSPRVVAVLLQDSAGTVMDFFCAVDAFPGHISVPVTLAAAAWNGLPLGPISGTQSYQRRGGSNHRGPEDWVLATPTPGQTNRNLSLPFADAMPVPVTPQLVAEFTNGIWAGPLTVAGFAPLVSLVADDGNGHLGRSNPFGLTVSNDLAVSLTTPTPALIHPANGRFVVTVTNPGPDISSNVVVDVLMDRYFGSVTQSEVVILAQSQGSNSVTSVPATFPQTGSQIRLRGSFGTLPANGSATLDFDIYRRNTTPFPGLINLVTSATVTRTEPDSNLANNTALLALELSQSCLPVPERRAAWWRADGDGQDTLGTNQLTLTGAVAYSVGRVGAGALKFDGSDARAFAADAPELDFEANEDLTLDAWIRIPAGATKETMTIVDKRTAPAEFMGIPLPGAVGYALFVSKGRLAFQMGVQPDRPTPFVLEVQSPGTSPDLRDGKWHHVAVTVDRDSAQGGELYVDGTRQIVFEPAWSWGSLATPAPLRIGFGAIADQDSAFVGEIDEVSLVRGALGAEQVARIHQAGSQGRCLARLSFEVISPEVEGFRALQSWSMLAPYEVTLRLTNSGPLAVPGAMLMVPPPHPAKATLDVLSGVSGTNVTEYDTNYFLSELAPMATREIRVALRLQELPPDTLVSFGAWVFADQSRTPGAAVSFQIPIERDHDDDGLADDWELANGLNPESASDASADSDGDGGNNLQEFGVGTNPRDAADVLKLRVIQAASGEMRVRFPAKPGRTYRLQRRLGVDNGDWVVVGSVTAAAAGELELTDESQPLFDLAFYRLAVP